jgi:hypothetical protein
VGLCSELIAINLDVAGAAAGAGTKNAATKGTNKAIKNTRSVSATESLLSNIYTDDWF